MDTPLANAFFSPQNLGFVQQMTQRTVQNRSGIDVSRQNPIDMGVIMREIYLTNTFDPYGNIQQQLEILNQRAITKATSQVISGLAQYINYLKDIGHQPKPIDLPRSTTVYGNKIPYNNKIGL